MRPPGATRAGIGAKSLMAAAFLLWDPRRASHRLPDAGFPSFHEDGREAPPDAQPFARSRGKGNTIVELRSLAMSNRVAR